MSEAELAVLERACKPSIGACAGQFTANTMAMVAEALGLTVPNSAMVPGVYAERLAIARRAGQIVMQILRRGGPLPRDLVTRRALENASATVAATGGSTNAALHIPAIANEAGIRFTVDDVAAVFARTPLIGDLRPGGKYLAKDVHDRGGVSVIIRALIESRHIDGECLTLTGRTLREEHGDAPLPDGAVVREARNALRPDGGLAVLKGNLAPGGARGHREGIRQRR
jgi:dihydroxy-acid dehydratase